MATSTNYGWAEPDNSSLVKNGASDIRTLGNAIDTSVWNVGFGQAGKNKIINGDFNINQRSFTSVSTTEYTYDRWQYIPSGGTGTATPQTFTLGTAPVAGYESKNFLRLTVTTGNDFCRAAQAIESVRTFAGQTVTLSFYAKGTNPTTAGNLKATLVQSFGTGGSPSSEVRLQQTFVLTAGWTRYSLTFDLASIAGKTLGTGNNDALIVWIGQGDSVSSDAWTLDLWGVQLEYGSKATPFQTASGTLGGELSLCQRYYYRQTAGEAYAVFGTGLATSTTNARILISLPVTMRVKAGSLEASTIALYDGVTTTAITSAVVGEANFQTFNVNATVASGLTQYRPYQIIANNSTSAYLGVTAEL